MCRNYLPIAFAFWARSDPYWDANGTRYEPEGRQFDSVRAHHKTNYLRAGGGKTAHSSTHPSRICRHLPQSGVTVPTIGVHHVHRIEPPYLGEEWFFHGIRVFGSVAAV